MKNGEQLISTPVFERNRNSKEESDKDELKIKEEGFLEERIANL